MGLDMYAWRVKAEDVVNDFEVKPVDENDPYQGSKVEEIYYWRKHHDLHGWMENLYREKGGTAESFNCVKVRLTSEDLNKLQTDLLNSALPETTGFFFGNNPPDLESLGEDLKFIQAARDVIAEGDAVYYDSWW
jgi:hypothetical protein